MATEDTETFEIISYHRSLTTGAQDRFKSFWEKVGAISSRSSVETLLELNNRCFWEMAAGLGMETKLRCYTMISASFLLAAILAAGAGG